MAKDFAMSNNGDLIFAGNRDLLTVSDQEQVEQRIRVRLLLPRGTFLYDTDEFVGSDIVGPDIVSTLRRIGSDERVYDDLILRVYEALAPMTDIVVSDVRIEWTEETSSLEIMVVYRMTAEVDENPDAIGDPELMPGEIDVSFTLPVEES